MRFSLTTGALFLVIAAADLVAPSRAADEGTWTLPTETTALKAGEGRELVVNQCLLCHSADYIATQPPLTRTQWQASVEKMRAKYGAPISTNNVAALVDYLTAAYGKPSPAK
ncbi:MAG TPA: cytochrome c [Verrucomicrobiota bacterium]|nr:cytochrome c [Verrucomicrobiota bacterium]